MMADEETRLMSEHILTDSWPPADTRVVDFGAHVWAIIGMLKLPDWDVSEVAGAYRISPEPVHAAVAYYGQPQSLIGAKLLLNAQ